MSKKYSFSDITIVALHGNGGIEKELISLKKCMAAMPGAQGLAITDKLVDTNIPQKLVHQKLDHRQVSDFLMYCLFQYIDTEFALICQNDGWVLNANNWRDQWFEYDYIGGLAHGALDPTITTFYNGWRWVDFPEPGTKLENLRILQNGGLSLRSRKYMEAPTKYGIVRGSQTHQMLLNEDVQMCCFMRPALESVGIKFAPNDEALLFGFESLSCKIHKDVDLTKVFGNHSQYRKLIDENTIKWSFPQHMADEQPGAEDRVYDLLANHYGYNIIKDI
jgi:hypothetical protein